MAWQKITRAFGGITPLGKFTITPGTPQSILANTITSHGALLDAVPSDWRQRVFHGGRRSLPELRQHCRAGKPDYFNRAVGLGGEFAVRFSDFGLND